MKLGNISIFIPHNGCPHQCSFCNQKNITGQCCQPRASDVENTINKAISDLGEKSKKTEIAFFGGSFTAIDRSYMIELLDAARPYTDRFYGIRISTRPDYIDSEVLAVLKAYNVTSIELGAQSMDDAVLSANERGHTAQDVINASYLIKENGFSLGLQMMTGLYKSDFQKDIRTAEQFISLNPDTVRIYPTVIMKNTALADLYHNKLFVPYTLSESVDLCSKLIKMFEDNGISIIRLGLHYTDSLVKNSIGGNYHPAFKELCESKIFFDNFIKQAEESSEVNTVYINRKSLSKFIGQQKSNLKKLGGMGYKFDIKFDDDLSKYELYIK